MKIETDDNTLWACIWAVVGAVVITVAVCAYKYNCLAYEKGYTQQQIPNTIHTIWVKP